MRCPTCDSENPETSKFCIECGAAFEHRCPKCKVNNLPQAKFCGRRGASLTEAVTPGSVGSTANAGANADASQTDGSHGGERRHLTELFCDLVGSTAIASRLDPEEWRVTVGEYHRAAAAAITRFGGYVAKYLGDGVMAFFGWPEAHDNDAERAARAGLAIIDAIAKFGEQSAHAKLSARIGIDSGAVVVGAGPGTDADVFGDAPNIAARVEAAAEPGTVMVTAATHRLISGLFVVEDRLAQSLKGFVEPIQLYRVIQPSGVRGRLDAAAARGLTPFVGREDETRILMSRWERALGGEGQVALIVGEAGIGKPRLVHRFHEQIAGTRHTWIDAAEAFFQNTPLYPITGVLRRALFAGGDGRPDAIAQLAGALNHVGLDPAAAIPLLAPLLNLTLPPEFPPLAIPADQQRRRLLATLVEWMLGVSREKPLVIATEDLHWADPSTLELIQTLVEQGAMSPLLLLYTARPKFKGPWPMRAHHTQINLKRLGARDAREMIARVSARIALAEETVTAVVTRTGGVPLFVEELTRAVLERGGDSANREIPATLHDSLMARLDRLGAAKEVAQVAAVIGREFSYALLHAIHPAAEVDLQSALAKLSEAELIYTRGIAPDATYTFKHALIQDAAYGALLKTRRRELHRKVARTLTEKFADVAEAHPEVIARHWTEADETERAIAAWEKAAKAAGSRNAFIEAQESVQQALALLDLLPESPVRDNRELEFRQAVVSMLYLTTGWAASETIEAAQRTAALAEKSGNTRQFANWVGARSFAACITADLHASIALADQALELRLREGTAIDIAYSYMQQVITRFWLGDLGGAENCFEAGLRFFDEACFRRNKIGTPITVFGTAGLNAWMLGQPDVARKRLAQLMAATSYDNPHDHAFAGNYAAILWVLIREYEQAQAVAERALEVSEKHQFPNEAAVCRCYLGSAPARLGRTTDGIALIRQGTAGKLESAQRLGVARGLTFLADAQASAGAVTDALKTVERALMDFDEPAFRPETLRIRGELQLTLGHAELADADFRDSIALARTMSAKAWELRTTTSLALLLKKQGRREARARCSPKSTGGSPRARYRRSERCEVAA